MSHADNEAEEMSIAAIMKHTGFPRATAKEVCEDLDEAQNTFNSAKKVDAKRVTLSRRALWRLTVLAGAALGMSNLKDVDGMQS